VPFFECASSSAKRGWGWCTEVAISRFRIIKTFYSIVRDRQSTAVCGPVSARGSSPGDMKRSPDLFLWTERAMFTFTFPLAMLRAYRPWRWSVLDRWETSAEARQWVPFTHHHREQCQCRRLVAPRRWQHLRWSGAFRRLRNFCKMNVRLGPFLIMARFVRPPIQPIPRPNFPTTMFHLARLMNSGVWKRQETVQGDDIPVETRQRCLSPGTSALRREDAHVVRY
jgi:hypothetical protein